MRSVLGTNSLLLLALLAVPGPTDAQELRVTAEQVECIPIEGNAVGYARVENNLPDTETRLYFRRLNDTVEDLYYVRMQPEGAGRYWGVFPKAEDRKLERRELEQRREEVKQGAEDDDGHEWAAWWKAKELSDHRNPTEDLDSDLIRERASLGKLEKRHWMLEMDDAEFEDWLEKLENEPAEYFAAVHDAEGREVARSPMKVAEVRDDCKVAMTAQQAGEAENLTIGETATWQQGEEVFHWLCDGVVTRVDPLSVLRADERCRVCVIAWWQRPAVLIPAALGVSGIGVTVLDDDDDEVVSEPEPRVGSRR